MFWGSNLFHIGVLFLFLGHFVGLLTPVEVFHWLGVTAAQKQILAISAGGIFGTLGFIGATMLLHRRLFNPRVRSTSTFADNAILIILYFQLVLGLATIPLSAEHGDGSMMMRFMEWAQHVVTFRAGAPDYVSQAPLLFRIHLVLGMTVFLLFPFSRLVHIWSAPIWYPGRPYQIVRRRPSPEKTAR